MRSVWILEVKRDLKQFETLHSCRDNGLALCGGTSMRQAPTMQKYTSDRSMKYGVSTKMTHFHEQDYALIRCRVLFLFMEHVDRLRGRLTSTTACLLIFALP